MSAPTASAEVWNSANATKIADLLVERDDHGAESWWTIREASYKRKKNDAGSGDGSIVFDHPNADEVDYRRVIRLVEDVEGTPKVRKAFTVNDLEWTEVDSDRGDAARVKVFSGAGMGDRLNEAQILPYYGIDWSPISLTRRYDWGATAVDASGWDATLYVQPRTGLLIGGSRPIAFPEPYSQWIWPVPPGDVHPQGPCYFDRVFTLTEETELAHLLSADDEIIYVLDDCEVIREQPEHPSDVWWWTWHGGTKVPAGTHTIRARVWNLSTAGPGAFISSVWPSDGNGISPDGPIVITGNDETYEVIGDWRCLAYPAQDPGMTATQMIRLWVEENLARYDVHGGPLTGIELDFDDDTDSAGNPMPIIPGYSHRVPCSIGSQVRALSAAWIDWQVRDDGFVLQVWDKTEGQGVDTSAAYALGDNILALRHHGAA